MINFSSFARVSILMICYALSMGSSSAFAPSTDGASEGMDAPRRCMQTRNVDDFHVIDRHHVVLIDRRRTTFLLAEMRPGCWDITHAPGIALRHRGMTVCAGDVTTVQVMDTLQSMGQQCHVRRLQAVSSVEAAVSLVEQAQQEANDEQ